MAVASLLTGEAGVAVPTVAVLAAGAPKCIFWLWNLPVVAYHLRREDTDWFDKPREGHPRQADRRQVRSFSSVFSVMGSTSHTPHVANVSQMKLVPYACPHTRLKLRKDPKDTRVSGQANKISHLLVLFWLSLLITTLIFCRKWPGYPCGGRKRDSWKAKGVWSLYRQGFPWRCSWTNRKSCRR